MKISDIPQLEDKTNIDRIEGRVRGVFTKNPTANQKKHDIYPQDVVIEDDDGASVRIVIMKQSLHIPEDSKGESFRFEATPGKGGHLAGIWVDRYNGVNKLQADGQCAISRLNGEARKPSPSPEKETDKSPPPEVNRTSDGRITWRDHVDTLLEIIGRIAEKLDSDTSPFSVKECDYVDVLCRLGTTIYIQAAKDCLIKKSPSVPPAVVQLIEEAQPKAEEAPANSSGIIPTSVPGVASLAMTGELTADVIKQITVLNPKFDWEGCYDSVCARLVTEKGYTNDDINAAYDEGKGFFTRSTKSFSNADYCKTILSDLGSFKETIIKPTAKAGSYREEPATAEEDTIPF